jgi:lipoyl(octanoyl) transferase
MAAGSLLRVIHLGVRAYGEVLELQRAVARAVIDRTIPDDVLLLVEHPPVVTLGRAARESHMLASPAYLAARGVEVFEVERGGDVTFHGPGQLVGYPIVDLKRHRMDLHWYLRQVEQALIVAVAEYGIEGTRREKYTGVWVGGEIGARRAPGPDSDGGGSKAPTLPVRKLASIGVHARDWVTWHGFALNVSTQLAYFDLIVPCGIPGVEMTSLSRELVRDDVSLSAVGISVANAFGTVFDVEAIFESPESLAWCTAGSE